MPDALENWQQFNLAEAYAVVTIAETVKDDRRYRIEVLKSYSKPNAPPYSARAYVEEEVILKPAYSKGGKMKKAKVWTGYSLPWIARDTPDEALAQALDIFAERKQKVTSKKK